VQNRGGKGVSPALHRQAKCKTAWRNRHAS
jgi:hypothetical protein